MASSKVIQELLIGPLDGKGFLFHGGIFLFKRGDFSADVEDWMLFPAKGL